MNVAELQNYSGVLGSYEKKVITFKLIWQNPGKCFLL